MLTVRQLMQEKTGSILSTTPESIVFDAISIMANKRIGAMPVMDGDRLAGMFSERDYLQKVVLKNRRSRETQIKEIMTCEVITINPDTLIPDCMVLMTDKHIRHLPVIEDGQVTGIISIGDVIKHIIDEKDFVIGQLETYISG